MKKAFVLFIVIALIAGAVGGLVYAQSQTPHQPIVGQKLVGWGLFGNAPGAIPGTIWNTIFLLTNPDCVNQITIDRISVIIGNGTVIYEGVLLDFTGNQINTLLEPHQTISTELSDYYLPLPPDLRDFPLGGAYMVEVSWTGIKGALPITGWSYKLTANFDSDTGDIIQNISTSAATQMVNMTQLAKGK